MGNAKLKPADTTELDDIEIDLNSGVKENSNTTSTTSEEDLELFEINNSDGPVTDDNEGEDLSELNTEIQSLDGQPKVQSVANEDAALESNDLELGAEEDDLLDEGVDPVLESKSSTSMKEFKDSAYDELSVMGSSEDSTQVLDTNIPPPPTQEEINWRELIEYKEAPKGTVEKLLKQHFANELDKHIALQSIAVLCGDYGSLQKWKHCVWRHSATRTYPHDGRRRISNSIGDPVLKTDLRSLMVNMSPLLVQVYNKHFSIEYVAEKLKINTKKVQQLRKPLNWSGPVLGYFGFLRYAKRFDERGYQAFHIDGLQDEIIFDGKEKSFYFDVEYYKTKPIGFLFYSLLSKIWSLRLGYFAFLGLNITTQIFPVIEKFKETFETKKFALPFGKNVYQKFKDSPHGEKVRMFEATLFSFKGEQLFTLHNAMNDHIYKLLLADTLDLIGMLEFVTHLDLIQTNLDLKVLEKKSIHVGALYKLFTSLKP